MKTMKTPIASLLFVAAAAVTVVNEQKPAFKLESGKSYVIKGGHVSAK